jgi:hypothetical protein
MSVCSHTLRPDLATICHVLFGAVLAAWSVAALCLKWSLLAASAPAVGVNLYIAAVLWESARRIECDETDEQRRFRFPYRSWSLPLAAFVLIAVIASFAQMYIKSEQVHSQGQRQLTEPADAVYYSTVTLTTLGYGDFAPTDSLARWLVVWQLGTGTMLLLAFFPLVVARISSFRSDPAPHASGYAGRVAARLAELREGRGWSIVETQTRLGTMGFKVSVSTLRAYEQGADAGGSDLPLNALPFITRLYDFESIADWLPPN